MSGLMLKPMLASTAGAPLTDPSLIYEPKYDGIRAIVDIDGGEVSIWSRLGHDKTSQFPEIAEALRRWATRRSTSAVLDGEIVALGPDGEPAGFQQLQGRIHVADLPESSGPSTPAAFIAFDLLREGRSDLRDRPLVERRAALERLLADARSPVLRISESVRGDGRALYERALAAGWEGLIAKAADSRYRSGKRTTDWRKLKIVRQQEFVIGGWTEPRQTRSYFGALLLGVYEGSPRRLVYVGHTGTGFSQAELARLFRLLQPLETRQCPFASRPKTNERPHWVEPRLVADIKFTEWTADGKLRHPVYLGLRDDKPPESVVREPEAPVDRRRSESPTPARGRAGSAGDVALRRAPGRDHAASAARRTRPWGTRRAAGETPGELNGPAPPSERARSGHLTRASLDLLVDRLQALEDARRDGVLELPGGARLTVTNLHKIFWPAGKLTKGALFRYYIQVAPYLLPVVADRPLTMKRYPNGVTKPPFYQHRAPTGVPACVRVEHVPGERTVPARFIGGSLETLLYMTQLAAISQDPWFSRVATPDFADHAAFDLDPSPGAGFARVLDTARWIRDELEALGVQGLPKTSGARGLHIYVPLPAETPFEAALLFCRIIATVVAARHPTVATVERSVRARGRRVYIDCLQNIRGKTLAAAYSARASDYAGVSTPLTWREVDEGVRPEEFTIQTVPRRLDIVGDLWRPLRTSPGIDLSVVSKYASMLDHA